VCTNASSPPAPRPFRHVTRAALFTVPIGSNRRESLPALTGCARISDGSGTQLIGAVACGRQVPHISGPRPSRRPPPHTLIRRSAGRDDASWRGAASGQQSAGGGIGSRVMRCPGAGRSVVARRRTEVAPAITMSSPMVLPCTPTPARRCTAAIRATRDQQHSGGVPLRSQVSRGPDTLICIVGASTTAQLRR
jgi:hypothetical protein